MTIDCPECRDRERTAREERRRVRLAHMMLPIVDKLALAAVEAIDPMLTNSDILSEVKDIFVRHLATIIADNGKLR